MSMVAHILLALVRRRPRSFAELAFAVHLLRGHGVRVRRGRVELVASRR